MTGPEIIVGFVDPGTTHVGWAVVARYRSQKLDLVDSGHIETDPAWDITDRERKIWHDLCVPFAAYRPSVVGIENQLGPAVGNFERQMRARQTGGKGGGFSAHNYFVFESVGIAKAIAWSFKARVMLVPAQTLKIAVLGKGNGNATKQQVLMGVRRYFPGIERDGHCLVDHEADAIAGAIHVERVAYLPVKAQRRKTA